jgi:hypothetical protein
MAKPRKPIPKSQKAISAEKTIPFEGIENRDRLGNPNAANENVNPNYLKQVYRLTDQLK